MPRFGDFEKLEGRRFGRLLVLDEQPTRRKGGKYAWQCQCDCGKRCIVDSAPLKDGRTKSCGCFRREASLARHTTHGLSKTPRCEMHRAAKMRSKKRGVRFAIALQDVPALPKRCPVLGIPIFHCKKGFSDNSPSLDRIVSAQGYVPGNIRIISWRANKLKSDGTLEELKLIGDDAKSLLRNRAA